MLLNASNVSSIQPMHGLESRPHWDAIWEGREEKTKKKNIPVSVELFNVDFWAGS